MAVTTASSATAQSRRHPGCGPACSVTSCRLPRRAAWLSARCLPGCKRGRARTGRRRRSRRPQSAILPAGLSGRARTRKAAGARAGARVPPGWIISVAGADGRRKPKRHVIAGGVDAAAEPASGSSPALRLLLTDAHHEQGTRRIAAGLYLPGCVPQKPARLSWATDGLGVRRAAASGTVAPCFPGWFHPGTRGSGSHPLANRPSRGRARAVAWPARVIPALSGDTAGRDITDCRDSAGISCRPTARECVTYGVRNTGEPHGARAAPPRLIRMSAR